MFILCTKSLKHPNTRSSSVVNNPPAEAGESGDESSIPGLGRLPGIGNRNPVQYSCLENSRDKGAWWDIVHGHTGHACTPKPGLDKLVL